MNNTMFIFFLYFLAHSSVIQALRCYNGSHAVGIPWHVQGREEFEKFQARQRANMEENFPLVECDSQFSQCFVVKHHCQIMDAYYLTKGCALPEGNRTCVSAIPATCQDRDIKCVMCSDKNGCNKEEWQNNLTQTATTAKGLLEIEGANTNSTFDQKRKVPDDASANVHAAMSNTFVCFTAFLIILFHGMVWPLFC